MSWRAHPIGTTPREAALSALIESGAWLSNLAFNAAQGIPIWPGDFNIARRNWDERRAAYRAACRGEKI